MASSNQSKLKYQGEINLDGLGLLVLAHAGAALKHHFIQRDDVLLRMLKDRPD